MFFTKAGDFGGVMGGHTVFKYYYDKQIALHKTPEEAYKFAELRANRAISRSQQSGANKDTSRIQSHEVGKFFTMFRNSQQQYQRWELAAWRNLFKGRGSAANNAKIIVLYHLILPVVFQLISNLFTDENDETNKKRLLRSAILGSANGLLIVGDIMEFLLNKAIGEKWSYQSTPVEGSVNNMGYGVYNIFAGAKDLDREQVLKGLDQLAYGVNNLSIGLPYRPTKKIINKIQHGDEIKLDKEAKRAGVFVDKLEYAVQNNPNEYNKLKKSDEYNYYLKVLDIKKKIKTAEKLKKDLAWTGNDQLIKKYDKQIKDNIAEFKQLKK